MEGTRLRILQLLQRTGAETVEGLARNIGLAPATIRRHLDILQRDHLVAFDEVHKRTGRPEHSFHLTEQGQESLPKHYDRLLGMLVQEISSLTSNDTKSRDGKQILKLVFERMSEEISSRYKREAVGEDPSQRMESLKRYLEELDYSPEIDLTDGTLRLSIHNCPYRSVALHNRQVCAFDVGLISSLLGVGVLREEWAHEGRDGCVYTAVVDVGARADSASSTPG